MIGVGGVPSAGCFIKSSNTLTPLHGTNSLPNVLIIFSLLHFLTRRREAVPRLQSPKDATEVLPNKVT
ncbi:hypothetical protein K439DRAFT_1626226 [Ramaria rubella]|nr:hypothetical protein K439DRAFT_1626226 [Ramaria rubella]